MTTMTNGIQQYNEQAYRENEAMRRAEEEMRRAGDQMARIGEQMRRAGDKIRQVHEMRRRRALEATRAQSLEYQGIIRSGNRTIPALYMPFY